MEKFILTDYGVNPYSRELQTEKIQAVLDMCQKNGGTVVFPKGKYELPTSLVSFTLQGRTDSKRYNSFLKTMGVVSTISQRIVPSLRILGFFNAT